MVGHTGDLKATKKAVETVDKCIGEIFDQCNKSGYSLILTSDHGNADSMFDTKKQIVCTTHTLNQVPFLICDKVEYRSKSGKLADIAPTILKLLDIDVPYEMNGLPLIK